MDIRLGALENIFLTPRADPRRKIDLADRRRPVRRATAAGAVAGACAGAAV
jgi:hypothetical protein